LLLNLRNPSLAVDFIKWVWFSKFKSNFTAVHFYLRTSAVVLRVLREVFRAEISKVKSL
jgi:hypothetical protein